jgi:hypothetical protein
MSLCCLKLRFFRQSRNIYSKFNILATFYIVFFRNFGQNYGVFGRAASHSASFARGYRFASLTSSIWYASIKYLLPEPRSGDTCYQSGRSPRYQSGRSPRYQSRRSRRYLLPIFHISYFHKMGLLSTIKGFFNVDGVHVKVEQVNPPMFDNNSTLTGKYQISASFEAHILTVYLAVTAEIEGRTIQFARELITDEPFTIPAQSAIEKEFLLGGLDFHKILQQHGYNDLKTATEAGAIYKATIEIDVKEAAGLFDPFAFHTFVFAG